MGHRFSKNAANNLAGQTTSINKKAFNTTASTTNIIPIPNGGNQQQQQQQFVGPTINLQIQENSSTTYSGNNTTDSVGLNNHITTTAGILQQQQQHQYNINNSVSSSLTSVNNLSFGRQIIIKIQLAKMENGNETSSSSPSLSQHQQQQQDTSFETSPADCNLNSTELSTTVTAAGTQFLNLTLNSSNTSNCNSSTSPIANTNTMDPPIKITTTTTPTSSSTPSTASLFRTAGSSLNKNNNYLNSSSGAGASGNANSSVLSTSNLNERSERLNSLKFNDEIFEQNIGEIVEYCEVLENPHLQSQATRSNCNNAQILSTNDETDNEPNVCCRRKSKSLTAGGGSSMSSSSNTGAKAKSRCRKCSCRDAFKRFLDPSLSRSTNKNCKLQKEQKHTKSQDRHSINNPILNNTNKSQLQQRNSLHSGRPPTTAAVSVSSHVSLWGSSATSAANGSSDVVIPITTPTPSQFVVVQCAIVNPGTNATCNNLISIAAQDVSPSTSSNSPNESMVTVPLNNSTIPTTSTTVPTGPIVHSQVDFVHYLVPDLERITNSSFYWGKMDRYEAERLLEGKPEGTFLLRDSAQEEFLFSVTFRKYGRSLHARIEQSDHRFSFDCHDPCVFTAPTVTGLLEHYKGPSCVMFFEPMLTIPLHRKNCFSLQTLCRAKIVSNTTYDGINELELPARLKSYLKEYHYKQKLRVISNEHTYTLHCK